MPSLKTAVSALSTVFPKALPTLDVVDRVVQSLSPYGFGSSTLLVTSFCPDDISRSLEKEFSSIFGECYFQLGGLAGFAFGGLTGFGAMASHVPGGGGCVIVYGPHVGIDDNGQLGYATRTGSSTSSACCSSATEAVERMRGVQRHTVISDGNNLSGPLETQQAHVNSVVLQHADRLERAKDAQIELPYALFDTQDELMMKIVAQGCDRVPGKIVLLGGITINTPDGVSDYFVPLRFELFNNRGILVEDLMWEAFHGR